MKIVLTSLVLAMLLMVLSLPLAAQACGCGMLLPHEGDIGVTQERAIIRWDGQTEDIIMALQAQGNAKEAAWIMPVPAPAQVKLGDPMMFDFLQEFTKPRTEIVEATRDPHPGPVPAGGSGVALLDRRKIGLYDVSTLAATDAIALTEWLNTNGYKFPDAAAKVLQPYVDQGWFYIAARISPGKTSYVSEVQGELDPLWLTFKSDRLVYPMRPTALARNPLGVFLYILADHRMTISGLHTSFAGWISPADLPVWEHPIKKIMERKYFLTKLELELLNPQAEVKDDYYASQDPDVEYRDVQIVYRYVHPSSTPDATSGLSSTSTPLEGPSGLLLLGASFALLLLVVVVIVLLRKDRKDSSRL